jgi:hypothetical protein
MVAVRWSIMIHELTNSCITLDPLPFVPGIKINYNQRDQIQQQQEASVLRAPLLYCVV